MVNVHAAGGERMLVAARERLEQVRGPRPLLIAVTVLTSMEEGELRALGVERTTDEQVLHLARLSQRCGLDGVVCSAREAPQLRTALGEGFGLVTPGIRPAGPPADDQRRTMTPPDANAAGRHDLGVGRPITQAADPATACHELAQSLTLH